MIMVLAGIPLRIWVIIIISHQIASSSSDELFAVADDGNYYSSDAGQTWSALGVQQFNEPYVTGVTFTRSGKLLVSTHDKNFYISTDKGKTFTTVTTSAIGGEELTEPTEDQNGNLYVVAHVGQSIRKSIDGGKTWTPLKNNNTSFLSLFIDKNNWLYTSINSVGISVSKDNGANFTLLAGSNDLNEQVTIQSDGNLYYSDGDMLFQMIGAAGPAKQIYSEGGGGFISPYIVAKNNNILVAQSSRENIRYRTK